MAGEQPLRPSVADDLGSLADVLVGDARPAAGPELAAGTVIADHFVIEELIGRGGMGAVYRAHDRNLDRKVALKLDLRGADLARARREAVALARLAHPNVVTIHEVGEHDGAPFVAMELCEGGNARAWLRGRARRWRDVLAIYVEAGKGLAAAHAAGLVHRDVKPDNILIGADGRARIGDFGLAREAGTMRAGGPARAPDARDAVTAVSETRYTGPSGPHVDAATASRAIAGTPRYMAPEQRDGGVVDARSDQFGFSVALYEALAGVDPFPAAAEERAAAIAAQRLAPPAAERRVPRRVLQVVARGLRARPDARWPSVAALVAGLERAARSRVPTVAGGLIVLVAAGSLAWAATRTDRERIAARPPEPDPCAAVATDLGAVWKPDARAGFVARHGKAPATAAWTADVLDHFAGTWTAARRTVCVDAPKDPAWSRETIAKAIDCLADERTAIAALAATADLPPAELVAATSAVPNPGSCGRRERVALVHPPSADPAVARLEAEVQDLAARSQQAEDAGDPTGARALAEQAVARSKDAPPHTRALASEALGRIELARGAIEEGATHYRAAYFDYRAVSDGSNTYGTAVALAQAYAGLGRLDEAAEWLAHARAEAQRTSIGASQESMMEMITALVARAKGDRDGAVAAADRSLAALEAARDPVMMPNEVRVLATKATLVAEAGRLDESIALAKDTLARQERLYGPDHPELISSLTNIALGYIDLGKPDEALPWLARRLALADRVYPAGAVERAPYLAGYGAALALTDPAAAVPLLAEALRLVEPSLGKDSEDVIDLRKQLAAARAAARKPKPTPTPTPTPKAPP